MSNSVTHWKRRPQTDDAKWRKQQRKAACMDSERKDDYWQHDPKDDWTVDERWAHVAYFLCKYAADPPRSRVRWRTYALALVLVVGLALFLWSKGL